jgi:glycerol uptake facilitator-like aquaporin
MYGVISSQYVSPPYPKPPNYTPILNPTHSIFESCALFLCLCFSGQLTGGHCNPAVTTTLLISKGNKINPFIALIYISSQFVGALVGGLFGNYKYK